MGWARERGGEGEWKGRSLNDHRALPHPAVMVAHTNGGRSIAMRLECGWLACGWGLELHES